MNLIPMTFASGYASGLNAYLTVLVLGLCGRFLHTGGVPEGFQRWDVLIVMAVLAVLEAVADKIPYVDSVWDTVSTFIRPVAGALIGALIAGAHGDLLTISLASIGGVTALLSTLQKTGVRMAINTSPEPATNLVHSVGNDVAVTAVSVGAALAPVPTMIVAAVLLVAGLILALLLLRRIRRGWRRVRSWYARRRGGAAATAAEAPVESTPDDPAA